MDDRYIIDTPENIEFAYDIAGIGSRFLAAIIDTFLILLLQIALGILVSVAFQVIDTSAAQSIIVAVWGVLSFLFLWSYYLVFEMIWNGQSPGKRLIGLRVVRVGGRPITFISSAIRNLVRLIDFLPAFYGIGVGVMFIDQRSRRLGDLAAGTLVVKEQRVITLESLTAPRNRLAPPMPFAADEPLPATTLPTIHLLTADDFALIQGFLQQRQTLGKEARGRLGFQIAQMMRAQLAWPTTGDPERFLEYVAREYWLHNAQQQV